MEHNANSSHREAATDEPASSVVIAGAAGDESDCARLPANDPRFGSLAEEDAWWAGLTHGLRCAGPAPGRRAEPGAAETGEAPLTSARLVEAYRPLESDARGRAIRHDGFTPEAQRIFLDVLATCGVVADAARAAGVHRDSAYALRNRPEGRAFALAWQAAILIARGRMSDELMSRGLNGVVTRIYRNGELWGERHHHDNRLAMAVLSRLDRQAEGMGKGAAVAETIAQDWDRFLDVVAAGGEGTRAFLERAAEARPKTETGRELLATAAMLRRCETLSLHAEGRAADIATADLDPARMRDWTTDQWLRAELSGFLAHLPEASWPENARDELEAVLNGSCRSRRVYLEYHPQGATRTSRADPLEVWQDEEEDGDVRTNYPPPDGFAGYESGEWGEDEDYERELSPEEQEIIDGDLAGKRAAAAAERAEERAAAAAARDLYFGFAGDRAPAGPAERPDEAGALEPGAAPVHTPPARGEGDAG